MTTRDKFVARFGEQQATAIEAAAREHRQPNHGNPNPLMQMFNTILENQFERETVGSDQFQTDLVTCISFDCMEEEQFREHHGITVPWPDLVQWMRNDAGFEHYDGTFDQLTVNTGKYEEVLGEELWHTIQTSERI